MKEKYKSPYTKEELFKKYPSRDLKWLGTAFLLYVFVMWVMSLILI